MMWGTSFEYSQDSNKCLTPGKLEDNSKTIDGLFEECKGREWGCPKDNNKCLEGNKHKKEIGPEDDNYSSCLVYQNASCCTSQFTKQLSLSDVTHIQDDEGIFNWHILPFLACTILL